MEIIDHHKWTPFAEHLQSQAAVSITINEKCGSCSSLVADKFFNLLRDGSVDLSQEEIKRICWLLYAPIVLDTVALSDSVGWTFPPDLAAMTALESHLGLSRDSMSHFYSVLVAARNDTSHLTVAQKLEKDLKVVSTSPSHKIAISSIAGILIETLASKLGSDASSGWETLTRQLYQWSETETRQHYSAIVLLGLLNQQVDSLQRDLFIWVPGSSSSAESSTTSSLEASSEDDKTTRSSSLFNQVRFSFNHSFTT